MSYVFHFCSQRCVFTAQVLNFFGRGSLGAGKPLVLEASLVDFPLHDLELVALVVCGLFQFQSGILLRRECFLNVVLLLTQGQYDFFMHGRGSLICPALRQLHRIIVLFVHVEGCHPLNLFRLFAQPLTHCSFVLGRADPFYRNYLLFETAPPRFWESVER